MKRRKRERLLMRALGIERDRVADLNLLSGARFDRIYHRPDGTRTYLSGGEGHSAPRGWHHGPRTGCPVCFDGWVGNTAMLPFRFPKAADEANRAYSADEDPVP